MVEEDKCLSKNTGSEEEYVSKSRLMRVIRGDEQAEGKSRHVKMKRIRFASRRRVAISRFSLLRGQSVRQ